MIARRGVRHDSESRRWLLEILESESQLSSVFLQNFVFLRILSITRYACPNLVNRNHRNQLRNLGIKPKFLKIPNHVNENLECRTPRSERTDGKVDQLRQTGYHLLKRIITCKLACLVACKRYRPTLYRIIV